MLNELRRYAILQQRMLDELRRYAILQHQVLNELRCYSPPCSSEAACRLSIILLTTFDNLMTRCLALLSLNDCVLCIQLQPMLLYWLTRLRRHSPILQLF